MNLKQLKNYMRYYCKCNTHVYKRQNLIVLIEGSYVIECSTFDLNLRENKTKLQVDNNEFISLAKFFLTAKALFDLISFRIICAVASDFPSIKVITLFMKYSWLYSRLVKFRSILCPNRRNFGILQFSVHLGSPILCTYTFRF